MEGVTHLSVLKLLLCALLLVPPASATLYYVDNTDGTASDSNAGTDPADPWLTIGKCASTLVAGDTCIVNGTGYYDATITEATSGSAGNLITYKAASDCVTGNGVTINTPCPQVRSWSISGNYVVIRGFEITHQGSASAAFLRSIEFSGTNGQIINNYIHDTTGPGIRYNNADDLVISGNNIQRVNAVMIVNAENQTPYTITTGVNDKVKLAVQGVSTTATLTAGSRTSSQISSDLTGQISGITVAVGVHHFSIYSNTTGPTSSLSVESVANDAYTTLGLTVGTGAMFSGAPALQGGTGGSADVLIEQNVLSYVADYFNPSGGDDRNVFRNNTLGPTTTEVSIHIDGWQPAVATKVLIEGNVSIDNENSDNHFLLNQNTGSDQWIVRYNSTCRSKGGIEFQGQGLYFYNNTFYDNFASISPWTNSGNQLYASVSGATIFALNNLWYQSVHPTNGGDSAVYYAAAMASVTHDYSLWYNVPDVAETNDVNGDPLVTDGSTCDFTLQSMSPAIDTGGPLTTVHADDTGSGTSLIVTDAQWFQDGWAGVDPDYIAVGTVGNTVQISSIDYGTNTITLAGGISRTPGSDPIWLYRKSDGDYVLHGAAPEIGAFEYAAAPTIDNTSPLTNGDQNVAYSDTFTATEGLAPLVWSISAGAAPAEFTLNSSTGVFGGTTASYGTFNFTVTVTDALDQTDSVAFSLTIDPAAPVSSKPAKYFPGLVN